MQSLVQFQFQEPEFQGSDSPGSTIENHLSHPAAATTTPPPTSTTADTDPSEVLLPSSSDDPHPCKFCSPNPLKRPPPSSASQPKPKKPFTPQPTKASAPLLLPGYNVLHLPSVPNPQSFPPLQRCNSTPMHTPPMPPPPATNSVLSPESLVGSGSSPVAKSPNDLSAGKVVAPPPPSLSPTRGSGTQLPPLPHPLWRSSSDPTPCRSPLGIAPDPRSANSRSPTPRCLDFGTNGTGNESPASKRLRRMSAMMMEMRRWFDEIMSSEDGDDDRGSQYHPSSIPTQKDSFCCGNGGDKAEKESGGEQKVVDEDALVSAERDGDSTIVNFKCPCGSGYHILLSGESCYYKLV